MNRRLTILLCALALLLLGLTIWAGLTLVHARRDALSASADLRKCFEMSARIEDYRTLPAMASDGERMSGETTGLITAAAKAAGIPTEKVVRIDPDSPARLGDSVYKEKPTQVLLRDVTLSQVAGLLHAASSSQLSLRPLSVRMSAPRNDTGATWTVELVLSYLIYDPPSTPETRSTK